MKRGGNKSGLSPVIASVLMIMLVLILAGMIFLWARGFISEQIEKFGKPIEEKCGAVDFRVEKVGNDLEILNEGNVDIWYLDVKMIKGGNEEVTKFDFRVDAGDAVKQSVTFEMADESEPDETIIYPVLLGGIRGKNENKPYTCIGAGKTI